MDTPERLSALRESLATLALSDDATTRVAARLAIAELDFAETAADPAPHHAQVIRLLDAVLNPDPTGDAA